MTVADNRGRVHGRRPGPVEIRARGKRMERGTGESGGGRASEERTFRGRD